jgi:hypothetical protein
VKRNTAALTHALYVGLICIALFSLTRAQEPGNEVTDAVETMGADLRSPLAKFGLDRIVFELYEARVKLAPHKYEAVSQWQSGFKASFSLFQKRLSEGKLEDAAAKVDKGVIERMQKSFTRNQKANEDFLRTAQEQSPTLRSVSIPVLLRTQTYFSLIVSLASPGDLFIAQAR